MEAISLKHFVIVFDQDKKIGHKIINNHFDITHEFQFVKIIYQEQI